MRCYVAYSAGVHFSPTRLPAYQPTRLGIHAPEPVDGSHALDCLHIRANP
jgi:hypothetical protein